MVLRLAFVVLFTCRLFAQSNQQVSTHRSNRDIASREFW